MFIGHFAVGLAAKRAAPRTPLPLLMAAPLLLDMLWPIFLVLGLESVRIDPGNTVVTPLDLHDYPWSHSLLMAVVWSVLFAGLHFAWKRQRRVAVVLALGVFSHWILDFVTHRPDMPLYPGSTRFVGLGLWNSLPGTLAAELGLFAVGVALYLGATRPRRAQGRAHVAIFFVTLLALYFAAIFGPPPPSVPALIGSAFAFWLLLLWAHFLDRGRQPAP